MRLGVYLGVSMTEAIRVDGTPTDGWSPWIDSLVYGGAWSDGNDQRGGERPLRIDVDFDAGYFSAGALAWGPGWYDHEIAAFERAFAAFEAVAGIEFNITNSSNAEIEYYVTNGFYFGATEGNRGILATHETPGYPHFGDPDDIDGAYLGIFNFQGRGWDFDGLREGGFGFRTVLHELAHGLGLAHPHDGGTAPDAGVFPGVTEAFGDYGEYGLNQGVYTIMSYNTPFSALEAPPDAYGWFGGPMALDIYALQLLYGANMAHRTGDDVYQLPGTNGAGAFWTSIWDAGGSDTISAAGSFTAATIDLREAEIVGENAGGYISRVAGVQGGFTIANGATIENAEGGEGDDILVGNGQDNILRGFGGNDTLRGLGGNDTLDGGEGDDLLYGGADDDTYYVTENDQVFEEQGGGRDTVIALCDSFTLSAFAEDLQFDASVTTIVAGRGNARDNTITGGRGGSRLFGFGGDDTLIGDLEDDELRGGTGADTLRGNSGSDLLFGDAGDDALFGDVGEDTLRGGNGDDALDGGASNDTLEGGDGDDTLFGDTGDDLLSGGEGNDTLDGGASNDTLNGDDGNDRLSGSTGADDLSGGKGNDRLDGGSDSDILRGGGGNDRLDGGTGDDRMVGGNGNDTFFVDNTQDVVVEIGGGNGGRDTVVSRLSFYQLASGVENLRFSFDTTPDAVTGFGNGLDNKIKAIGGATSLLRGEGGDDRLIGANLADVLEGGRGNDQMTGKAGDDTLKGEGGRDRLDGGGGDDILTGNAGRDTFFFRKGYGDDTITDFDVVRDTIEIGRGANRYEQLDIAQDGTDVVVSFRNVTITLEDTSVADITRDVFDF